MEKKIEIMEKGEVMKPFTFPSCVFVLVPFLLTLVIDNPIHFRYQEKYIHAWHVYRVEGQNAMSYKGFLLLIMPSLGCGDKTSNLDELYYNNVDVNKQWVVEVVSPGII